MDPVAQQPLDGDLHAEFRACEQKRSLLCRQECTFDRPLKRRAPGDYQELGDLYKVRMGYLDAPENTQDTLKRWNVNPKNLLWVDVSSRGKKLDVAYKHRCNARYGTILCIENMKDRDINPDGRRLWPSEIGGGPSKWQ